ncbi:MAG: hypothetical protein RI544_06350 [Haloquadratum sp.]|jgi:hypothetical protein|nr:hypothetical protein [Haloquadratum sp.]
MGTSPSEPPRITIRGAPEVDAATVAAITAAITTLQATQASTAEETPRAWAVHARAAAVGRR